jgi:asparagine synthase (glutamine-hydrolysing)
MNHLFAFVSTLSADYHSSQQGLIQRLNRVDSGIVYELNDTKNKDLLFGSFFYATKPTVSTSNKTRFYENDEGDCLLFEGNMRSSDLVDQYLEPERTPQVQLATQLVQLMAKEGGNFIAKVSGSLVYMANDARNRKVHVGKDPLNPVSIYWIAALGGILISTDLRFLSMMADKPISLSEKGLASWLSGFPNPAISLFNEIQVLPSGYRMEINQDLRVELISFWDIEPDKKIVLNDQRAYSEQFQGLLSASVAVACRSECNTIVSQMSGGLDSTSITSLANEILKKQNKRVLPLSHLYSQANTCNEADLINDMLAYLHITDSLQIDVDGATDRDFISLYPTALESPGTVLSPRYAKELAIVQANGADVLLSGNGGDEMCWGHSVAYTQRLKEGDFGVIAEVLKACRAVGMSRKQAIKNLFVKPFLPDLLLRVLGSKQGGDISEGFPNWLTPKAKELAQFETKIANPFDYQRDPVGFNRYQSLKTTATYNAVKSYQQLGQQFGVEVRHPFFNKELAEFTFAIPAKQLIQGPFPKWLLRSSMTDKLPKSVCWNIKKITFDQHFGNLVRENADAIRKLFNHSGLAQMGLINQTSLLTEFDRVVNDSNYPLHVDLLYAILTYSWLNTHFPEG